ncbi:hypothetical protein DPMN_191109 [Dreissena polymorpha]|uniref:Uncharacterized protein n=1 Tax=Dreissena polymorpha TaxID=45954 RepID=A0A9D4B4Y4_DREPO|nr:hypothetical protein DPMN_191109 [Dreissena polymorpha]
MWRGSVRTATAGTSRAATSASASRATDWPPPGTPVSTSMNASFNLASAGTGHARTG